MDDLARLFSQFTQNSLGSVPFDNLCVFLLAGFATVGLRIIGESITKIVNAFQRKDEQCQAEREFIQREYFALLKGLADDLAEVKGRLDK